MTFTITSKTVCPYLTTLPRPCKVTNMNIIDTIQADQIEVGDQILVDLDPIEVSYVGDDPEAPLEGIRVMGYSHESGDTVTYDLYFSDDVNVWSV